MKYRREIDGLRAVAVISVILYHAGLDSFSGGYVGVDVFFVISGYLITTIIIDGIDRGKFSIIYFYERRARRILPALLVMMAVCIPFAWIWLPPTDMKDFSQSLIAAQTFTANIYFWLNSGYFETATELKILIHTWSLAVEEQFYILFPLFLIAFQKIGKRAIFITLGILALASLLLAEYVAHSKPVAAFYLLPTRSWEILIGSMAAIYISENKQIYSSKTVTELLGWLGVFLIFIAVFSYNKNTPFPGVYAMVPTIGTILIILFASNTTSVGRFLGSKICVSIGLISYSAYLWHQPIFAFARHRNFDDAIHLFFLTIVTFLVGFLSWKFIETPFRKKITKIKLVLFLFFCSLFLILFGIIGNLSNGYKFRYGDIILPNQWDPPVKCHGAEAISNFINPLYECLGQYSNGVTGDIFLLGDSHAAQLSFALNTIAKERNTEFHFINTENKKDFPMSYIDSNSKPEDRIFKHIMTVADPGDFVIISFHRGHLNKVRDKHIPLDYDIKINEKYNNFVYNLEMQIKALAMARIRLILVKDTPLLSDASSIENCAYLNIKNESNSKSCSVLLEQDLHTRKLQSMAFTYLANKFPDTVSLVDPIPTLYGDKNIYNPINTDGSYKMIDRNHLSVSESLKLIEPLRHSLK